MAYVERYVKIGEESTWGQAASNLDAVMYPLSFDARVTENRTDEDIIAPSRQARARQYTTRDVALTLEWNPLGPRMWYAALGSATEDETSPYSIDITGSASLPSLTVERGLYSANDTSIIQYVGAKVDRLELTIENGEDISMSADMIAKNTINVNDTFSNREPSFSLTSSSFPLTYSNACLIWGGTTLELYRVRAEVNNNLIPRFAGVCTSGDNTIQSLQEGGQYVLGEFRIMENLETYFDAVTDHTQGTITIKYGNASLGTVTVAMNNVGLDEFADSFRGREDYEVDIPFVAMPTAINAYDAITVTYEGTLGGTITDLLW